MEQERIAKQMIEFQKAAFNNTFNAMVMLQEQSERMLSISLEQAAWLPEEGKKVMNKWGSFYKKSCEDFKKAVDESYKKMEDFLASSGK